MKLKYKKQQISQLMVRREESSIDELNGIFAPLSFRERLAKLYDYFPRKEILLTSSFGTKSIFLLHLLSEIQPKQKVHFIDTTYHFPETLHYKKQVTQLLNLPVIDVQPKEKENKITREDQWWIDHPKMCCTVNKVAPLDPIISQHTVWISGLMAYQTPFRSHLRIFEQQGDILKFHPLIDIDEGEFLYHMSYHQLPRHPLEEKGYGSIGCIHCTVKGDGRTGRWKDSEKTECGLHPSYYTKK